MKRIGKEISQIRNQMEGNSQVASNKMEDLPLLMKSDKIQAILNEEKKKESEKRRVENMHLLVR